MKPTDPDTITAKVSKEDTDQSGYSESANPTTEEQAEQAGLEDTDGTDDTRTGISNTPDVVLTTVSDRQPSTNSVESDTYMLDDSPVGDSSGVHGSRSGMNDICSHREDGSDCAGEGQETVCSDGAKEPSMMEEVDANGEVIVHSYFEGTDYEEIPDRGEGSKEDEEHDYSTELYDDWTELTHTKVSNLAEYIEQRNRLGPGSLRHEFTVSC